MIPIRDDNPTSGRTHVTIALIVVNVAIFVFQITRDDQESMVWKYGYVPAQLTVGAEKFKEELSRQGRDVLVTDRLGRVRTNIFGQPIVVRQPLPVEAATALPAWINIFTCMFLHGGWMHLLGNMLYLWIFGNNVEDRLGPVLFFIFYIGTGLIGNLAHTVFQQSWAPLVGASGAISGVMGAYILLYPHTRILALVPLGWYWFTVKLPAWLFLGIYIVAQNLFPATFGRPDSVAYWAHIGGFAAGVALIYLFPLRPAARAQSVRAFHPDDADFEI
jgi:hypothetical protein